MICQHVGHRPHVMPYVGSLCPDCFERLFRPQLMSGAVTYPSLLEIGQNHAVEHARWLAGYLAKCREAVE